MADTATLAKVIPGHTLQPIDAAQELPAIFQLSEALLGQSGFVPAHLKTKGAIAAVILAGRELGLPPMVSLRSLFLIEGKVGLYADVQLGLMAARAGVKWKWIKQGHDGIAELEITRPGNAPHTQRYTIEDAQRAGLAGKPTWKAHPSAMLRARCVSAAAKTCAPDVLNGVYTPDELEEIAEKAGRPVQIDEATGTVTEIGDHNLSRTLNESRVEMTAVQEEQARRRNESEAIAVAWIEQDIPNLVSKEGLEIWLDRNGHAFGSLHPTPGGRLWTAIKNAAERLSLPLPEAKRIIKGSVKPLDRDDEITEAEFTDGAA